LRAAKPCPADLFDHLVSLASSSLATRPGQDEKEGERFVKQLEEFRKTTVQKEPTVKPRRELGQRDLFVEQYEFFERSRS
jgi:hypothetical protein